MFQFLKSPSPDFPYLSKQTIKKRIKNNDKVFCVLRQRGDIPSIERNITHYIYFRTVNNLEFFKKELDALSYRYEVDYDTLGIIITICSTSDEETVNVQTLHLCNLCAKHTSTYDGWETVVCKSKAQ